MPTYCRYCKNVLVPDDGTCSNCQALLDGPLLVAREYFDQLTCDYTVCCAGIDGTAPHLWLHSDEFGSSHPPGYEQRNEPGVSVEGGIRFEMETMRPYYIVDTGAETYAMPYGEPVAYADLDWSRRLMEQVKQGAEYAFGDNWLTCTCGEHYDPTLGEHEHPDNEEETETETEAEQQADIIADLAFDAWREGRGISGPD